MEGTAVLLIDINQYIYTIHKFKISFYIMIPDCFLQ